MVLFQNVVPNVESYSELVQQVLKIIPRGSLILMKGQVGAGKTTFISYFCQAFQLRFVQSPTYAIHQHYQNSEVTVEHFDLYRLDSEDELQAAGFYDLINAPADYKFIEWSEKIKADDLLSIGPLYEMKFEVQENQARLCVLSRLSD